MDCRWGNHYAMATNQPVFLLKISGNVTEKLKTDETVLAATWEYPRKQTSVLVKTEVLDAAASIIASKAIKKHFSIYGIVRSVQYCSGGAITTPQADHGQGSLRRTDTSRDTTYAEVTNLG